MLRRDAEALATPGKRERRKFATRGDLIRAGRRLFSEKGLYESRIEDLTTEAGIAKGTLYTYFADKDELIRAVASAGFEELEARVASRVGSARSLEDVLRQALRAHTQFFVANPDLMRVLHQVRGMLKFDRPEWGPLRDTMNRYLKALAGILSKAPHIARLLEKDRLELARLVFGAVSGVTSVEATSTSRGLGRSGGEALVNSMVAMAVRYVKTCGRSQSRGDGKQTRRSRPIRRTRRP